MGPKNRKKEQSRLSNRLDFMKVNMGVPVKKRTHMFSIQISDKHQYI